MGVRTKPQKLISFGIIMAATVIALTGCSDELEPDLAACKTKTMEVSRAAPLSEEKAGHLPPGMYARQRVASKRCLP